MSCTPKSDYTYLTAHLPQGSVEISIANRLGRETRTDDIELHEGDIYGFFSYLPKEQYACRGIAPITISRIQDQILVEKTDDYQFYIVTPGMYEVRCELSGEKNPKVSIGRYISPTKQEIINLNKGGKTYRRDTNKF